MAARMVGARIHSPSFWIVDGVAGIRVRPQAQRPATFGPLEQLGREFAAPSNRGGVGERIRCDQGSSRLRARRSGANLLVAATTTAHYLQSNIQCRSIHSFATKMYRSLSHSLICTDGPAR